MSSFEFEREFFRYLNNIRNEAATRPLVLGGTSGGTGGPPGGFIGYLPQLRVSYDPYELAVSGIANPSGIGNIVDNLNHIRYRIVQLESASGTVSGTNLLVYHDSVLVASGVTIINLDSGFTVTDNGSGEITVTASGGTTSSGISSITVEANDSVVSSEVTTINFEGATVTNDGGGQVTVTISGGGALLDHSHNSAIPNDGGSFDASNLSSESALVNGYVLTANGVGDTFWSAPLIIADHQHDGGLGNGGFVPAINLTASGIDSGKVLTASGDGTVYWANPTASGISLADHDHSGVYSAAGHTHALDDLSDVIITTPTNGQLLEYNGANWVNSSSAAGLTHWEPVTNGDPDSPEILFDATGDLVMAEVSN